MRKLLDYKPETTSLVNRLIAAGFTLDRGSNGGDPDEDFKFNGDLPAFLDELIAADEAHLFIRSPKTNRLIVLYLVLGNEPGYIVCDYTVPNGNDDANALFAQVESAHNAEWEAKKQPTKEVV